MIKSQLSSRLTQVVLERLVIIFSTFVTNAKQINNTIVYSSSSQLLSIYKTDEDLSNATYTVTNPATNATVASGSFQKVNVSGSSYFALCLSSDVIQASFDAEQTNHVALDVIIQNGSTKTAPVREVDAKVMGTTASMQLPPVTATADGQPASQHFGTQKAHLVDANEQPLGDVPLSSQDVAVSGDGTTAQRYTYGLNATGLKKVQDQLETLNQQALTDGGLYYTVDSTASGSLELTAATTKPAQTMLTITYVDDAGQSVKTDTVTGHVGDKGTYTPQVPAGYELAGGQNPSVDYTLADGTNNLTIKLKKQATVVTKQPATLKVDYVDENGTVVTTDTVTGHIGDQGTYAVKVPSGYELADGQTDVSLYTLNQSATTLTIKLKPQTTAITINYAETTGHIVKTITVTGHMGDKVALDQLLPSGYQLTQSSRYYTIGSHSTTTTVEVTPINQEAPSSTITVRQPRDQQGVPVLPHRMWPLVHQPATKPRTRVTPRHRRRSAKPMSPSKHATLQHRKSKATHTTQPARPAVTATPQASQLDRSPQQPVAPRNVTVTVLYTNGDTGHILATELLTGKPGQRIVFDTYQQILPLQKKGYYVVTDDTMRLNVAHFGNTPATYKVVLRHYQAAKTPETQPASPSRDSSAGQQSAHQSGSKHRQTHHTTTKRQSKRDQSSPVVFDPQIQAMLTPSANGSGDPQLAISELGSFFISLSGTINFGTKTEV